uniref:(northern house mosquito) hypothetical protein n=1 Tax=Culex pipiens TaxID=7175 RepID=A0A8D8FXS3_CULPI
MTPTAATSTTTSRSSRSSAVRSFRTSCGRSACPSRSWKTEPRRGTSSASAVGAGRTFVGFSAFRTFRTFSNRVYFRSNSSQTVGQQCVESDQAEAGPPVRGLHDLQEDLPTAAAGHRTRSAVCRRSSSQGHLRR